MTLFICPVIPLKDKYEIQKILVVGTEGLMHMILTFFYIYVCSGGKRSSHIPYRDSKLTRILQTSLGGNARTAIICTISPALSHVEQSRNTLSFATSAKEVTNSAQVNMVLIKKFALAHATAYILTFFLNLTLSLSWW